MPRHPLSTLILATALLTTVGCGQLPMTAMPVAFVPEAQTSALRKTPLPPLYELRLKLQRCLYQASKPPEVTYKYEIGDMYRVSMPATWRFDMIETKTDSSRGLTTRQRVWGLFNEDKMLVKVTKAEPVQP